ncbi:MAG: hypothetical protein LBS52_04880 [Dysgonamonadaceae bacterium]|nr:hypothetical protein [Dysgonamonadaceae bacterium]
MRSDYLASITKKTVFDAAAGTSFTSDKGVLVNIDGGCLYDELGNAITGNVDLSYTELFDAGSMVIADKPLVGKGVVDGKNGNWPLVTGGEFNIVASQNDKKLNGCRLRLDVPGNLTDAVLPDGEQMTAWTAVEDGDSFTWEESDGDKEAWVGRGENSGVGNSYFCSFPFGWTNIDWLYSLPGTKTSLCVKVPTGFTNKNAAVFAAYVDMPATLALFDVYVSEGEGAPFFTEHTGVAPIGYQMYIIFISLDEKTDTVIYSMKKVTVEDGKFIRFEQADLKTASLSTVVGLINNFVK